MQHDPAPPLPPEPLDDETVAAMQQLTEHVAQRIAQGAGDKKIIKELTSEGMSQQDAEDTVAHVRQAIADYKRTPEGKAAMRGKYIKHIIFGLLWFAGGTIVTVATYSNGGTYIVAWGAIIIGALESLYGIGGLLFSLK